MRRHQRLLEAFVRFCDLPNATEFRLLVVAMYCYQQHPDSGLGEKTVTEKFAAGWVKKIKWPQLHKFDRFNGGEDLFDD